MGAGTGRETVSGDGAMTAGVPADGLPDSGGPGISAVLVVGGSPEGVAPERVRELAARADRVVAVDRGLDLLMAAGVAPQLFCGDVDSVSRAGAGLVRGAEKDAAEGGSPLFEIERYSPEKDYTDLSLALRAIHGRWGEPKLLCCCLGGGRPDHFLGVFGRLASWPAAVELHEDASLGQIMHGGGLWELDGYRGCRFSFVPLTPLATVSLSGMHWALDRAEVPLLSDLGISNAIEAPHAALVCHEGVIAAWVFER